MTEQPGKVDHWQNRLAKALEQTPAERERSRLEFMRQSFDATLARLGKKHGPEGTLSAELTEEDLRGLLENDGWNLKRPRE